MADTLDDRWARMVGTAKPAPAPVPVKPVEPETETVTPAETPEVDPLFAAVQTRAMQRLMPVGGMSTTQMMRADFDEGIVPAKPTVPKVRDTKTGMARPMTASEFQAEAEDVVADAKASQAEFDKKVAESKAKPRTATDVLRLEQAQQQAGPDSVVLDVPEESSLVNDWQQVRRDVTAGKESEGTTTAGKVARGAWAIASARPNYFLGETASYVDPRNAILRNLGEGTTPESEKANIEYTKRYDEVEARLKKEVGMGYVIPLAEAAADGRPGIDLSTVRRTLVEKYEQRLLEDFLRTQGRPSQEQRTELIKKAEAQAEAKIKAIMQVGYGLPWLTKDDPATTDWIMSLEGPFRLARPMAARVLPSNDTITKGGLDEATIDRMAPGAAFMSWAFRLADNTQTIASMYAKDKWGSPVGDPTSREAIEFTRRGGDITHVIDDIGELAGDTYGVDKDNANARWMLGGAGAAGLMGFDMLVDPLGRTARFGVGKGAQFLKSEAIGYQSMKVVKAMGAAEGLELEKLDNPLDAALVAMGEAGLHDPATRDAFVMAVGADVAKTTEAALAGKVRHPEMPAADSVEGKVRTALNVGVEAAAESAEAAKPLVLAGPERTRVAEAAVKAFGKEEADAGMALMDARATAWAEMNGAKDADEWFKRLDVRASEPGAVGQTPGQKLLAEARAAVGQPAGAKAGGTEVLFQDADPNFYSAVQKGIESAPAGKRLEAAWWKSYLSKQGATAEELEWTGVADFLDAKKSNEVVTKDELREQFVEVPVEEKWLPGAAPENEVQAFVEARLNRPGGMKTAGTMTQNILDGKAGRDYLRRDLGHPRLKTLAEDIVARTEETWRVARDPATRERTRLAVAEDAEWGAKAYEAIYDVQYELSKGRHGKDLAQLREQLLLATPVARRLMGRHLKDTRYDMQQAVEWLDDMIAIEAKVKDEHHPYSSMQSLGRAEREEPKWGQYVVPGESKNYRELLLKLPAESDEAVRARTQAQEAGKAYPEAPLEYRSPHWAEPNVLVHARVDDRVVDGKRVLFINEIQSDWHQAGKKVGYASEKKIVTDTDWLEQAIQPIPEPGGRIALTLPRPNGGRETIAHIYADQHVETFYGDSFPTFTAYVEARAQVLRRTYEGFATAIPDGPFKDRWADLALKRIMRFAADNGYEGVVLTKGEDIQKVVGGEASGQNEFYDRILRDKMQKLGKKLGMEVRAVPNPGAANKQMAMTEAGVPAVFFTEASRANAQKAQALFQLGDANKGAGTAKGAIEFLKDGKAIIHAFQAKDVSTLVHEVGHLFRRDLDPEDAKIAADWVTTKLGTEAVAADGTWSRDAEELFARGFERWLHDGKAPSAKLQAVFAKLKVWLSNIYQQVAGSDIDVKVSPEMQGVFERLFASKKAPLTAANAMAHLDEKTIKAQGALQAAARLKEVTTQALKTVIEAHDLKRPHGKTDWIATESLLQENYVRVYRERDALVNGANKAQTQAVIRDLRNAEKKIEETTEAAKELSDRLKRQKLSVSKAGPVEAEAIKRNIAATAASLAATREELATLTKQLDTFRDTHADLLDDVSRLNTELTSLTQQLQKAMPAANYMRAYKAASQANKEYKAAVQAYAKVGGGRAAALSALESEATHEARVLYKQNLAKAVRRQLKNFKQSFRELPQYMKEQRQQVDESLDLVADQDGTATVNAIDLRQQLDERYGAEIVQRFLDADTDGKTLAAFLAKKHRGALKPKQVEGLQQVLEGLQAYAKQESYAERGLGPARMVMQAWSDPTNNPKAWRDWMRRDWVPLIAKTIGGRKMFGIVPTPIGSIGADPDSSRMGQMNDEFHTLVKQFESVVVHADDELYRVLDADPDNVRATLSKLMDSTDKIVLPDGNTTWLNARSESYWATTKRSILGQIAINKAGNVTAPNAALMALSRVWLPIHSEVNDESARKLMGHAVELLTTSNSFDDFVEQMQKATVSVLGAGETDTRHARAMGAAALATMRAAFLADGAAQLTKKMGLTISVEEAKGVNAVLSGDLRSVESIEATMDLIATLGIPFKGRDFLPALNGAKAVSKQLVALSEQGAFIPQSAYAEVSKAFDGITKQLDAYDPKSVQDMDKWKAWAMIVRLWKGSHTSGIILPKTRYWPEQLWGNHSQMVQEIGWTDASYYTFQNGLENVPMFRTWVKPWADAMANSALAKKARGTPMLGSLANAIYNPRVSDLFAGREGFYRAANGRVWSYDDLRKLVVEEGILDTQAQEDLLGQVSRVANAMRPDDALRKVFGQVFAEHANYAQARQRTALFLDLIVDKGMTPKAAGAITKRALYDWSHGIAQVELGYFIGKNIPFYRFYRLALAQAMGVFTEPFVNSRFGGDPTKLARARSQLNASKGVVNWMLGEEDEQSRSAEYDRLGSQLHPQWPGPGLQTAGPASEDEKVFWRSRGRDVSHVMRTYPRSTTLDSMEQLFTIPQAAIMAGAAMKGAWTGESAIPADYMSRIMEPWIGMAGPGVRDMFAGALETYETGKFEAYDPTPNESTYRALALLDVASGGVTQSVYVDDKGRRRADYWAAMGFATIPFIGNQMPEILNAGLQNPYLTTDPERRDIVQGFAEMTRGFTAMGRPYYYKWQDTVGRAQRERNARLKNASENGK